MTRAIRRKQQARFLGLGLGLSLGTRTSGGGGGGPTTYVGPTANNTVVPTSPLASGQMEQSTIHTVRCPGGITDIQLVMPGWYVGTTFLTEIPLSANYTFVAAVEYPVNSGNWTTITTSGVATGTCIAGTNKFTDLVPFAVPDGANYRLFQYLVGTSLPQFLCSTTGQALASDEGRNSSSGATSTPKNVTDNDTGPGRRYRSGAVAILGTRTGDSVAILGDSMQSFANSANTYAAPADHNRGDIAATIGGTYAYINLGVSSDALSYFAWVENANRLELARKATIIASAYGTNEFGNRNMSTATIPLAITRRALPLFKGKKFIAATITPRTTGAWTLVDGSDQTVTSYAAQLVAYNSGLTYSGLLSSPIDRFSPLQNPNAANKIIANGTPLYATSDGLHLSPTGVGLIAATGSTVNAQIAAIPAQNLVQDSIDLIGSLTFSGGFMTNGRADVYGLVPGRPPLSLVMRIKKSGNPASTLAIITGGSSYVFRAMSITTAGKLAVNTPSTSQTGTTTITDGVEHEILIVYTATTWTVSIDGVVEFSNSFTLNSAYVPALDWAANLANGLTVREVSLWNIALPTTYTPAVFVGNEAGLIGLWHSTTDATGIMGSGLVQ